MAKFSLDVGTWVEENIDTYEQAKDKVTAFSKAAVYEGSKATADAIAAGARQHGNLANGLRISKMQTNTDGANTLIYFDGYDTDGVAFSVKANSLESGRSDGKGGITGKHPFFASAVRKASKQAKQNMLDKFNELMNEFLGG